MSADMVADFTHLLLAALLLIGGVELNPGPKCMQFTEPTSASNESGNLSTIILPKLLSQPAFLFSDADIAYIQREIVNCRQEILNKSDELCEKTKELNMKEKLLLEKDMKISKLLELCESLKTSVRTQETKIVQLENQRCCTAVLIRDCQDHEILEKKCKEFEEEVENLESKVVNLSEQVKCLTQEKQLLSQQFQDSENVIAVKMSVIASCQEGDWRSALPLLSRCLTPDDPAHHQLLSVKTHTYCVAEAASQGHVELLKELLVHGFPPDSIVSHDGTTMLHRAAWNGRIKAVQLLLQHRAPVDSRDSVYSRTALMYAALGGHDKTLAYLLDNGASINAVDGPGWSALHLAAMMGHANVVWNLLSCGADVMLQSKNGQTAGDIARQYHKQNVVTLLSRCVQSQMHCNVRSAVSS